MTLYVLLDAAGEVVDQFRTPGASPLVPERDNPGGLEAVAVERFARPGERLIDGAWVRDADAASRAIDRAFDADHGALAKIVEHQIKALEARILLGTLAIDGLVAREAREARATPLDLARAIVERAEGSPLVEAMLQRRVAKRRVRDGGEA